MENSYVLLQTENTSCVDNARTVTWPPTISIHVMESDAPEVEGDVKDPNLWHLTPGNILW